jgi:hypothetical protein
MKGDCDRSVHEQSKTAVIARRGRRMKSGNLPYDPANIIRLTDETEVSAETIMGTKIPPNGISLPTSEF